MLAVAKLCFCCAAVYIVASFTFNFKLHCVNWYFMFCGDVTLLHVAILLGLLCFKAPCQFTQLHFFCLIFGLTPFVSALG
jgi:hypothetical protein